MATKKESTPKKAAPKKTAAKKPAEKKTVVRKTAVKPAPAPETQESLYERIAKKAYEIFESRGRETGRDIEHWLEAEKIVKGKKKA
ncbi:MAG TPA: DUF2934 domain-containing protein [Thermodesulfobacteriota bacterium]|nr:DUF2934 domain-containing protein [Thermodesulfobacteriota bacterium]